MKLVEKMGRIKVLIVEQETPTTTVTTTTVTTTTVTTTSVATTKETSTTSSSSAVEQYKYLAPYLKTSSSSAVKHYKFIAPYSAKSNTKDNGLAEYGFMIGLITFIIIFFLIFFLSKKKINAIFTITKRKIILKFKSKLNVLNWTCPISETGSIYLFFKY